MHLFKSAKYSPTTATTSTFGGGGNEGDGGLSSSGNGEPGASTSARMKHKSMDMSFFPFSNFLTRSISRKVASSPERVPRRNNEFDTPGFLSRTRSINKRLERSLSRSKSVAKGRNGNVLEVDTEAKPSHRRSQSTTRKSDWFSSFVGGRDEGSSRGKSVGEGSGSSRSKSTAARSYASDGGGSGSSRSCRPETDDEEGSWSRSRSTARRSESMSGPLPRGGSRRSNIPIMFSNSKGKPQPVEKTLECSLEELLSGCVKKVLITRDVVFGDG